MKYAYEDLSPEQFETLVVLICKVLLGAGVQGFAKGPDGGRDARFVGTAQLYPSTASPWSGPVIAQAKHTIGYNKSFGETDFFSPTGANTVIAEETPRIIALRAAGELDFYMLFANRRLPADAAAKIRAHLSSACDLPGSSIALFGIDDLDLFLKAHPGVAELANLDPVDSPLIVSPDELAEVVTALANNKDHFSDAIDAPPVPRVSYEAKNAANNLTDEYAKALRKRYLKDTAQIRSFLAAPENEEILRAYESVVEEFELAIIAKRKDHQTFDEVMEHLLALLFGRDPILRQRPHKRLTRAVLFYMYWNCDIGREADA
jgi:hypothetical protein